MLFLLSRPALTPSRRIPEGSGRQRVDDRLQRRVRRPAGVLRGRGVQPAVGGQVYGPVRAQSHGTVRGRGVRRRDARDRFQPRRPAGRSVGRAPQASEATQDHRCVPNTVILRTFRAVVSPGVGER